MEISNSIERGFTTLFEWLPSLIGAIVILIIGYVVARIVKAVVYKALGSVKLDHHMHRGDVGVHVKKVVGEPSRLVSQVAFWMVMLGTLSLAVTTLGMAALTDFVAAVYAYLPHVIAATLIFLVAAAIAGTVSGVIARVMGDTPTGKVAATIAPIMIMTIASFMILTELMIAEEIVLITYAALLGAIALGAALAFGLGGREAAARLLEKGVDAASDQSELIRRDVQLGTHRAQGELKQNGRKHATTTGAGPM